MREILFGLILASAAVCIVIGVDQWSAGAAWIVGGVLLAVFGYLVLNEDAESPSVPSDNAEPDA